jgi:2-polyprenyl-3-methyl-5-hydroxy-6-metoxy-1,4-benzoquinol methylase
MKCRHCDSRLKYTFIDLGSSPPSNAYISEETVNDPEKWYPLKVMVCEKCWLVQTVDFVGVEEMFSDEYAYFSSFSKTWLIHAEKYVEKIISRFNLSKESTVVEVAANDGYLLQYVKNRKIPCYGIEPTYSTARAARKKGIEIKELFFSINESNQLVKEGRQADLMVANNVLAHVPDINDFVTAFSILIKPNGVITFEFPHLLNLIQKKQFDTIYHEHYSYLSLTSITTIFDKCGLSIFDVEEVETHGGSLRVYAQHSDTGQHTLCKSVAYLQNKENLAGVNALDLYQEYQRDVEKIKIDFLEFLLQMKRKGKKVIAYGAAAKGNTLLNFSGVHSDLLTYVVDKNPKKQGKLMPGSRIPIYSPDRINLDRPDCIVILPWNIKDEVIVQLAYVKEWNCKFVTILPEIDIIN